MASLPVQPPLLPGSPLADAPAYTPVPNVFLDEHMALLENGELRVLFYITRRTFGFRMRPESVMTIDQIAKGYVKNGIRKDNGTGMDVRGVQRAVKSLTDKGIIRRVMRHDAHNHPLASSYALVIGNSDEFDGDISTTSKISQDEAQGDISTTSKPSIDGDISTTTYKEIKFGEEERKKEHSPLPLKEESEKIEPETEDPVGDDYFRESVSSEDDWTIDGGDQILLALRSVRGLKITAKIRQTIRETLAMTPIRIALIEPVVERFAAWAHGLGKPCDPALVVRGRWMKMLKGDEPLDLELGNSSSDKSGWMAYFHKSKPEQHDAPSGHNFREVLPPLAEAWNAAVVAGPQVEAWSTKGRDHENLIAAHLDLGFTNSLDKVLAFCHAVWQVHRADCDYVTFSWLIKPGAWSGILNHKYDYLLKPEKPANGVITEEPFDVSGGLER